MGLMLSRLRLVKFIFGLVLKYLLLRLCLLMMVVVLLVSYSLLCMCWCCWDRLNRWLMFCVMLVVWFRCNGLNRCIWMFGWVESILIL